MLIYEEDNLCWVVGPCCFNRSSTEVYKRLVFNPHITLTQISKHNIKLFLTTQLIFNHRQSRHGDKWHSSISLHSEYVLYYYTLLRYWWYAKSPTFYHPWHSYLIVCIVKHKEAKWFANQSVVKFNHSVTSLASSSWHEVHEDEAINKLFLS